MTCLQDSILQESLGQQVGLFVLNRWTAKVTFNFAEGVMVYHWYSGGGPKTYTFWSITVSTKGS